MFIFIYALIFLAYQFKFQNVKSNSDIYAKNGNKYSNIFDIKAIIALDLFFLKFDKFICLCQMKNILE